MKRVLYLAVLVTLALLMTACSTDRTVAPDVPESTTPTFVNPEQAAAELLATAGWPLTEPDALPAPAPDKMLGWVTGFDRTEVVPGIAHYRWEIKVGFGPRDRIALHRVVKESRPNRPERNRKTVFLQHGDAKDFTGMFLPGTLSPATPDDFGAAVYWARRGVDVWGIDQGWNLVEAEVEDFGFMADWGLDRQARDLGTAVTLARLVRLATGNGFNKMILLGYSSGSATGYALVNDEARLPPGLRQVGGWIPVDYSPVTDNQEWNQIQNCDFIASFEEAIAAGEYGYFVGFDFMGNLARNEPAGDSPVFPGFTNMQAAMYLGAGPIFNVGAIHYLAGVWQDEMPVDFVHTTVEKWLDFMVAGSPWEPNQFILDYAVWGCGETDVRWDDHFAEITVPVLNFGGAGGISPTTQYCLTLLGSDDITDVSIQLRGPDEALYDFGHIDLWIADSAPDLVWQPMLDWISAHTPGTGHDGRHATLH